MIAKQSIGSSFMGALNYNLKKFYSKDESKRAELLATNFVSLNQDSIKKELHLIQNLNPRLRRNTYHTSLNFDVNENISNEKMLQVAREYLEKMGFDNNGYFIFRHHDSNHPHCHILATRSRFDGTVVSDSNNFRRSEKIVRELEKKFGLTQVQDSSSAEVKAPNKDEIEMVLRTGKASKRMIMQEIVAEALKRSNALSDFIHNLRKQGVYVLFNQASTGRVSGISYLTNGFTAKGQALGNQFKWANIQKSIKYEQSRDSQIISQANLGTKSLFGENPRSTIAGLQRPNRDTIGISESTGTSGFEHAESSPNDQIEAGGRFNGENGNVRFNEDSEGVGQESGSNQVAFDNFVSKSLDTLSGFGDIFSSISNAGNLEDESSKRKRKIKR